MDNYLSHRWPAGAPAAVEEPAGRAGRKLRRRKKREERRARKAQKREERRLRRRGRRHPVLRGIFITLLVIVLLAGIAVGSWFAARTLIPMWMETPLESPEGSGGKDNLPPLSQSEEPSPTLSIPRAELEEGVTLTVSGEEGEVLTPREIYEQVLPSVVLISAYIEGEDAYTGGSGVIMSEDGYVITNYHVIKEGSEATVTLLADESVYPALLVGYDESLDLAILKIEAEGLQPARFGDSDSLHVGDPAYAIGNPLGMTGTMTDGIISYLNRTQTVDGQEMTLIQTSVTVNSGNSGGALVNRYGQVVGIVVAKISGSVSGSALTEGIGFAIPITASRPYINRILAAGESWKPTIGITCYAGEADGVPGIMVATVEAGTPAAQAGLRPMDFITHANGIPLDSVYALKRVLGEVGVGGTLTCTLLRDGGTAEVSFALIDASQLPSAQTRDE